MTGVVVAGMHRSGTSTVAGMLATLGLDAGPDPRTARAGRDNQRGFWEIRPLSEMNEELLRAAGGSWSAPPLHPWLADPAVTRLRARAQQRLARHLPADPWLWKDPRLSLTLPFWRGLGLDPSAVVLVVRHPSAVADSVAARNDLPRPLGLALWEHYNRAAVASTSAPLTVVSYEAMLSDPEATASLLATRLGEIGLAPPARDVQRAADFVHGNLAHQRGALLDDAAVDELHRRLVADACPTQADLESVTRPLSAAAIDAIEQHRAAGIAPYRRWRRAARYGAGRLRQALG